MWNLKSKLWPVVKGLIWSAIWGSIITWTAFAKDKIWDEVSKVLNSKDNKPPQELNMTQKDLDKMNPFSENFQKVSDWIKWKTKTLLANVKIDTSAKIEARVKTKAGINNIKEELENSWKDLTNLNDIKESEVSEVSEVSELKDDNILLNWDKPKFKTFEEAWLDEVELENEAKTLKWSANIHKFVLTLLEKWISPRDVEKLLPGIELLPAPKPLAWVVLDWHENDLTQIETYELPEKLTLENFEDISDRILIPREKDVEFVERWNKFVQDEIIWKPELWQKIIDSINKYLEIAKNEINMLNEMELILIY